MEVSSEVPPRQAEGDSVKGFAKKLTSPNVFPKSLILLEIEGNL